MACRDAGELLVWRLEKLGSRPFLLVQARPPWCRELWDVCRARLLPGGWTLCSPDSGPGPRRDLPNNRDVPACSSELW